jgi:hypothetical protein
VLTLRDSFLPYEYTETKDESPFSAKANLLDFLVTRVVNADIPVP